MLHYCGSALQHLRLHLHTLDVCEGAWVVVDAREGRSGLMRCVATLHGPSPSLLKDAGSEQSAVKPSRHLKLHDQDIPA